MGYKIKSDLDVNLVKNIVKLRKQDGKADIEDHNENDTLGKFFVTCNYA